MDVSLLFDGESFIWDESKARANVMKHGIKFEDACLVFFDPFLVTEDATDDDEEREAAIGIIGNLQLLYVVHLHRINGQIRIVSAREATRREKRLYENHE